MATKQTSRTKPARSTRSETPAANSALRFPPPGDPAKNRFAIDADCQRFERWCRAALAGKLTVRQWIEIVADRAAAAILDATPDEITLLQRIPAGLSPTVIHFGISTLSRERIERTAAKRGKTVEEYLTAAICEQHAADFVEDLTNARDATPAPRPIYGLRGESEIFLVDEASRLTSAPSFAEFVREVLLSYSEGLLAANGIPVPEIPARRPLAAKPGAQLAKKGAKKGGAA